MYKLILITCLLLLSASASAGQLLIAVAANFTGASRALVQQFQAQTGHRVRVSFGSTGKLYAQIENGAPFELYLAADSKHPQRAIEQGLAVADSRFTYAKGQLVLWSAKSQRFDDAEALLHAGTFARLALANPQTAPYGLAAQQVLQRLQLWSPLRSKLVQGDSIAQTFQFTATGNADIGFIARAQLHSWRANSANKPGTAWMIPASYYDPIEQQAVLLNRGVDNPVAQQFLNFLKGEQGRRIISDFGYPLDDAGTDAKNKGTDV
ncbi:MAG: molybdate ABC transporter substrate-binding protein [Motiliproteus sp.]